MCKVKDALLIQKEILGKEMNVEETMYSLSRRLLQKVEEDLVLGGLTEEQEWDLVTLRNALLKVKERT